MEKPAPERYDSILKKQLADWHAHVDAGKKGNPFATLCRHCYGRHAPPNDEICPRSPPKISDDGRKS